MATTASVARNLLKNRSLPHILRAQIIGRSNVAANINNIDKDHQIAQSLYVSNQNIHAQIPLFHFSQRGSLFGSYGGLSHGMDDFDIKVRGSDVEEDDDSDNEFDDDFDGELVDDDDEFDDDDDEDDDDEEEDDGDEGKFEGSKYKNKL